jgi:hypothetical protein
MHQQQVINQQSSPMAARSKALGTATWAQANDQSATIRRQLSTGLDSNAQRLTGQGLSPSLSFAMFSALFSALFLGMRRSFTYNTLAGGSTIGVPVCSGLGGITLG